jgi:two-component system, OmpR family, sensor histidine kinase KdpD
VGVEPCSPGHDRKRAVAGDFQWHRVGDGGTPLVVRANTLLPRVAVSAAAVGLVTGGVFALKGIAPVLGLSILYLLAVLPIAVLYGLWYALGVSITSMLAFNFFFLPPLHTLALTDSENWVALGVFVITAVVVSELATRARRRGLAVAEAETLRRSDAAKTAVLHAASHDLRSPLTAIRVAVGGLQSGSVELGEEDSAALLETIRLETARLERLVGNLLDLSRLEAGAAPAQRELWPVDELVLRALESLGPDAARVEVSLDGDAPLVNVDAGQLERVLVNLIENALRFSSPADPVELVVSSTGDDVLVRISDHGPGLDEVDLERIFEPFEHGRKGGEGTGLGLAIARGFAEANGARLWAEAQPGAGAAFTLAMPSAAARPTLVR